MLEYQDRCSSLSEKSFIAYPKWFFCRSSFKSFLGKQVGLSIALLSSNYYHHLELEAFFRLEILTLVHPHVIHFHGLRELSFRVRVARVIATHCQV
jgi:hypothetical protein